MEGNFNLSDSLQNISITKFLFHNNKLIYSKNNIDIYTKKEIALK